MNLLFTVVYAAHASGTHHKLALDALRHLQCTDAERWQRLFLAHAKVYLEGSKAPDTQFKDFKNHVLHTRDGYWGGALDKVRSWYQQLVEALSRQDWPTAVHCGGVLSHYYTDPLHPFHTAQSEAENNIHRAVEWSISRSYDALAKQAKAEFAGMTVELPAGPNWLAQLVCQGADRANRQYEKLIAHYDFQRGVVDPPAGLDRVARRVVAELIRYAVLSYAAVLDRAITEASVHAPSVPLAGATLAAIGEVPIKLITRRIADKEERRLVERMYDELVATGTVDKNLTDDDRTVRDLHAAEVLAKRAPLPSPSQVFPFKAVEQDSEPASQPRPAPVESEAAPPSANVVALHAVQPAPSAQAEPAAVEMAEAEDAQQAEPVTVRSRPTSGLMQQLERLTVVPMPARGARKEAKRDTGAVEPRFHLTPEHDVVDGPSIGQKTAARLNPHGIKTVGDLLEAEPAALAALLDNRHITAETIADWQDQARMVCAVPGLRGTHAQLLVGAGYRSAEAIAAAEADKLCADVLAFAVSTNGQRLLRNGDPPDIEKIKGWLEAALSVRAA
jgi:Domain of unknown function (DUF4332)